MTMDTWPLNIEDFYLKEKDNDMSTCEMLEKPKNINDVLEDWTSKGNSKKKDNCCCNTKQKTYVSIILDCSSSMTPLRDTIIEAMNTQIDTIKNKQTGKRADNTFISFTTFATLPDVKLLNRPISSLSKINRESYVPSGMTALNDAIADTLNTLEKSVDIDDKDSAFLVLILTDGQENNSVRYTTSQVKEMIEKRNKTDRWTFTYIGTEGLQDIAQKYSFNYNNMMRFNPTNDGVRRFSSAYCNSVGSYLDDRQKGLTSKVDMLVDTDK